jgi:hypothetical protein
MKCAKMGSLTRIPNLALFFHKSLVPYTLTCVCSLMNKEEESEREREKSQTVRFVMQSDEQAGRQQQYRMLNR